MIDSGGDDPHSSCFIVFAIVVGMLRTTRRERTYFGTSSSKGRKRHFPMLTRRQGGLWLATLTMLHIKYGTSSWHVWAQGIPCSCDQACSVDQIVLRASYKTPLLPRQCISDAIVYSTQQPCKRLRSVSYTHLTLPTILLV